MAKKNRNAPKPTPTPAITPAPAPVPVTPAAPAAPRNGSAPAAVRLPLEVTRGDWTIPLLAVMACLGPALGSPVQILTHETLKATTVVLVALVAAFAFFWQQRERREPLRWHALLWFPLVLLVYALGSMVWSHTYFAAVDAVRWFLFGLILWLGTNTGSRDRVPLLAWGIHLGALAAGCWAALQFWFDIKLFAQGPNPGSTFTNRNFFAEFVACTLPFGLLLLARARTSGQIGLLAVTNGFVIVSLMMTGTRSALVAMWLNGLLVLPLAAWRYRSQLPMGQWSGRQRALAAGLLLATVAGLGSVPTGNKELAAEQRGSSAVERALRRTGAIQMDDTSLGFRFLFLRETAGLIRAHPLAGVGAGAWEDGIARTQNPKLGIDNHASPHNEFVQLVAEYGIVGWLALLGLLGYLALAVWRLLAGRSEEELAEGPLRVTALGSVLALFLTGSVGFPWHMSSPAVVFALSLAILCASDARLYARHRLAASRLPWSPLVSQLLAMATLVVASLAGYVSTRAIQAERSLVTAASLGALFLKMGDTAFQERDTYKARMLDSLKEGIALAPNYRVLIEPPAEQLNRLRDWKNAAWAWEAISTSRPHAVSYLVSTAQAYARAGDAAKATTFIERIKQVRPDSLAWMPLEVLVAGQTQHDAHAVELGTKALQLGMDDFAMLNAAFEAAWRIANYPAAQAFMDKRMESYPGTRQNGLILLGKMYMTVARQPDKAMGYLKAAVALSPPADRQAVLAQIPQVHWAALGYPNGAPAKAAP